MPVSRFDRSPVPWALLAISGLTLATALYLVTLPAIDIPRAYSQLPMLEGWWSLVRLHGLQPVASWMQSLGLACVVLAAALAMVLGVSRRQDAGLVRLRRALATGSAGALYFLVLRPWQAPQMPWTLLLDPLAFALAAGGAADLTAFLAAFPSEPRLEQVTRYVRQQMQPSLRAPWLGRLRDRANAAFDCAFSRLIPVQHPPRADAEGYALWSARNNHRLLELMQHRRVRHAAIGLGFAFGILWALGAGTSLYAWLSPFLALGVLPMAGFAGIGFNYRFGDDESRRRIGWLYVLPVVAFVVCSATWFASLILLLLRGFEGAVRIAGMPGEALWLASSLLFFPVIVAALLLSIALALFYQGSLDPRLALRKGSLIALLGVLLTTLFVAAEGAVSAQIVTRLGWPDQVGTLAAGTLTALGFAPLRNLIEARANRLADKLLPARDLAEGHRETLTLAFVDISGYTALAARDEHGALLLAGVLRKSARDAAEHRGGRLVKTIGDAAMLCFPAPAEALAGLMELRQRYQRGTVALEIEALPLHAGLHHGEVVVGRDGDLYGAEVNLAARLQGAATDGQLLASETVIAAIGPGPGTRIELTLKHIPQPVAATALDW